MQKVLKKTWVVLAVTTIVMVLTASLALAVDPPNWVAALYVEAQRMVGLRWTPVPGATGYKVLRSTTTGSGYVEVASSPSPQYFDKDVEAGEQYFYVLQAVAGAEVSTNSTEKTVVIPGQKQKAVNPPTWSNVDVVQKTEFGKTTFKVTLQWASNPDVVAYNIYRSETAGKDHQLIGSVSEESYVDTKVEVDKTYYYVLTALDSQFQETPFSEEKSALLSKTDTSQKKKYKLPNPKLKVVASQQILLIQSGDEVSISVPGDCAVDSEGNIYVLDVDSGTAKVFTPEGAYLKEIGEKGTGKGQVTYPTGIGLDTDDNVYFTDRAGKAKVVVFDSGGGFVEEYEIPVGDEEFMKQFTKDVSPLVRDIAIANDGRMYVVDANLHRLVILDEDGEFIKAVGQPGGDPGQFNSPGWIAINEELGEVHITNGFNRRIEVYDLEGNFVRNYGLSKSFIGSFVGATGITFDDKNRSIVVDTSAATIQYFSPEGDYLFTMGDEKGETDKKSRQRSNWTVRAPAGVTFNPVTNQVVFSLNMDRSVMTRELME